MQLIIPALLKYAPALTVPLSTPIAIVQLPIAQFNLLAQREGLLRVVLPSPQLAEAMKLLMAADREQARCAVIDGDLPASPTLTSRPPTETSMPAACARPVLRIGLGGQDAVMCTLQGLNEMTSVLSFNEAVRNAAIFFAWLQPYQACSDVFPAQLGFLVGASGSVAECARFVASAINVKEDGDPVWQYAAPPTSAGGVANGSLYGGLTVTVRDILANGQQDLMTNGVLDAAFVELREMAPTLPGPGPLYVLTINQSEAFTAVYNQRVQQDLSIKKMAEVFQG
eukprot:TRINITY_DN7753_c0_g1_i1.p2 TRINITY_DN7753_c0_g1~~TRINITY_DN7753_c0_g1_i1.p2  ORF type:complete len:283 (-),score=63.31 TRINITY_DN7753_c0_g1_i1:10-858(-)